LGARERGVGRGRGVGTAVYAAVGLTMPDRTRENAYRSTVLARCARKTRKPTRMHGLSVGARRPEPACSGRGRALHDRLARRAASGLPPTLLGKALLEAALLTRLEVEAVLLDVLADAFALHLAAEAAEGLLEGLVVADGDDDQGYAPISQAGADYPTRPARASS